MKRVKNRAALGAAAARMSRFSLRKNGALKRLINGRMKGIVGLIDPKQLSGWFDQCGAELVLYARGWLDAALAEDVVQEAFIKLMAQRRAPDSPRAWLFRVVRNEAITCLRRQKRRRAYSERLMAEQCSWFEFAAEDLIDARSAQEAMESLQLEQREVVILRIWGQMSFKEIGQIVGKPISTVHSRYEAALVALRKKMEMSCKTKNH
jgi:RNA polymerase sigma factor (sigma-70 family)